MPFFSVIIPLFNKENDIKNTLNSVLEQSFKNYEIIVVNDGSTDKSLSIVESLIFPNSFCYSQKNKGLSSARNKGISLAKGEYFAFLDADDLWMPDYLNTIHKLINKYPDNNIYGCRYIEKRHNKYISIKTTTNYNITTKDFIIDNFFAENYNQFILDQSSIILKQSFAKKHLYNELITYNEDVDYYLKYFIHQNIIYNSTPLMIKNFDTQNQLSETTISNKKLPDLDSYYSLYKNYSSIKKYIDIQRYKYIIKFKVEKNISLKKKLIKKINFDNLSLTQKIMVFTPRFLVITIRYFKILLLKYKIRLTTS